MSSVGQVKEEAGAQTHVKPAEEEAKKPAVDDVGDVPDPDEDDLDDLDDMLDDFSNTKLNAQNPADAHPKTKPEPTKAAPAAVPQTAPEDDFDQDEFTEQLQAGMAEMLGGMQNQPDMMKHFDEMFKQLGAGAGAGEGEAPADAPKPDFEKQLEEMFKNMGAADGQAPADATKSADPAAPDASFQDTIKRTMERMQNSGDQATAAAATGGEEDFMAEMMKAMTEGGDSEEGMSKMLMGMMEQLTNKEVLYEPLKELNDKFPEWLEKNKEKTSEEDLKRYERQQEIIKEIVAKFEESTYSDSKPEDRKYVVDRMQTMQEMGQPPSDLVGDMDAAKEAFNGPDESCNPQ